MKENYYTAKYLSNLHIGAAMNMKSDASGMLVDVRLVGISEPEVLITTFPAENTTTLSMGINNVIEIGAEYEFRAFCDAEILIFESAILDYYTSYGKFMICSFPEMVEVRKLRSETRYPCTLPCDIRCGDSESYGAISDISGGGCLLQMNEPKSISWLTQAQLKNIEVQLEIMFPFSEEPQTLLALVRSVRQHEGRADEIGLSFCAEHDVVYQYLDSLSLQGIGAFFT